MQFKPVFKGQLYIKRIIHPDEMGLIQGCKDVTHHINKTKDKNHMTISTDVEKAFNIHLW